MGKEHCNENHKKLKMLSYQVKATTYLRGSVKDNFLNDCVKIGGNEAVMLRDIVTLHYDIMKALNLKSGADFSDVLKQVTKNKY